MYLAHIREDGKRQSLEEHLRGTAELCAKFAAAFGEEQRGYLIGYAHDIGKSSEAFQHRLFGGRKVDHATAGALECAKTEEILASCCVIGHHGGLPDFGNQRTDSAGIPTYWGRIRKGVDGGIPDYHWQERLPIPASKPEMSDPFSLSLWVRMLYSCLVDADYLDTETFMADMPPNRKAYDSLEILQNRLVDHIRPWFPGENELNRNRCKILSQCLEKASQPRGIYTLTVPTGGGKTVSSLAFALRHAIENGMDRVIYVIPYTSIIEQNAAVFRKILGENNVVEHHSGVLSDAEEETDKKNVFQRMATENWDAPVIVTTAVQFFESLYSNRPSQCRKLHNIANSVIVFDEAQMLPTGQLEPCVGAIANLAAHFRASVVLCTATQPAISDLFSQFCPSLEVKELCPSAGEFYQTFRRVTYRDGGTLTNEALAHALTEQEQVLCIVNTRKTAQEVFRKLPGEGAFHLSTLMCPIHRKSVLEQIRLRLKEGKVCRVVSTSLIEAGVDVDFPKVFRELSGLDSVVQAAGRCNREGKRPVLDSEVTYFVGEQPVPMLQRINVQAAREALSGSRDPGDPDTIQRYFVALRSLVGENMDKSGVVKKMREGISGCMFPFKQVSEAFHMIDQVTSTIYVPVGDGAECIRLLCEGTATRETYRKAGQYGVSVYPDHYLALQNAGDIFPLSEQSAVLTNSSLYDKEVGLSMKADPGKAEFI